jgi:hypothetical protein
MQSVEAQEDSTHRLDQSCVNINPGKVVRVHLVGHRVDVERANHLGHGTQPCLFQSVVLHCARGSRVEVRVSVLLCAAASPPLPYMHATCEQHVHCTGLKRAAQAV